MSYYTCDVSSHTPGQVRVSLTGAIDYGARNDLIEALRATVAFRPQVVHADLSGVSFFSAEGATFLVRLQRLAERDALSFLIDGPSRSVRRVLAGLGLTDEFRVAEAC